MFEGRAAIGYDHCYDAEVFYLGLALDPKYVEGFVEGCLERMALTTGLVVSRCHGIHVSVWGGRCGKEPRRRMG